MASRNVHEFTGVGEYVITNVNGYNYFIATETGPSFPRGCGNTTVSHMRYKANGQPEFTVIGTFHWKSDALAAATADSNGREQIARAQEAMMPKEACYSNHNHDIEVKGACNYCGGTERTRD